MLTHSRNTRPAFTLVELIVAAVVGVLIAGATATALSQLIRTRTASSSHQQAFARADAAASRISLDLACAVRDHEGQFCKVAVVDGGEGDRSRDELLMLARSLRPVHGIEGSPEGDEYEVQYRIMPGADGATPWLWRRADPARDQSIDGGGVATPIVERVASLKLEATDGTDSWFDAWDSDADGIPHAVRVTVVAASDDGRTFATARRVVAIDSVPLIPESLLEEPEEEPSDTPASGTGNTNTGTGTGGTGTGGTGTGGAGTGGSGGGGGTPRPRTTGGPRTQTGGTPGGGNANPTAPAPTPPGGTPRGGRP